VASDIVTSYAITSRASFGSVLRAKVRRIASSHQVQWTCLQLLWPGCMELTACRHRVHDEQTNFQNITEILFLPSSFWYFIVTASCLLLGAHVLIVMGALQIYIDSDNHNDNQFSAMCCMFSVLSLQELCCRTIAARTTIYSVDRLPLPTALKAHLKSYLLSASCTRSTSLVRSSALHRGGSSSSFIGGCTGDRAKKHRIIRPSDSLPYGSRSSCVVS